MIKNNPYLCKCSNSNQIDWTTYGPMAARGLLGFAIPSLLGAKPWLSLLIGGAAAFAGQDAWGWLNKKPSSGSAPRTPPPQPASTPNPKPNILAPTPAPNMQHRTQIGAQLATRFQNAPGKLNQDNIDYVFNVTNGNLDDFKWALANYKLPNGNTLGMQYPLLRDMTNHKMWNPSSFTNRLQKVKNQFNKDYKGLPFMSFWKN